MLLTVNAREEDRVEDWRYEGLKEDVKQLREELADVRGRTHKAENWQSLFPLRAMIVIMGLAAIGIWVAGIAGAIAGPH